MPSADIRVEDYKGDPPFHKWMVSDYIPIISDESIKGKFSFERHQVLFDSIEKAFSCSCSLYMGEELCNHTLTVARHIISKSGPWEGDNRLMAIAWETIKAVNDFEGNEARKRLAEKYKDFLDNTVKQQIEDATRRTFMGTEPPWGGWQIGVDPGKEDKPSQVYPKAWDSMIFDAASDSEKPEPKKPKEKKPPEEPGKPRNRFSEIDL